MNLPTMAKFDKFYDPLVFGVNEELHNTPWGGMPGNMTALESQYVAKTFTEPADHYELAIGQPW